MNRNHGICFVLILFIAGSFAYSYDCSQVRCKPLNPSTCRLGVTKDVCGKCSVCYKTLGEECGGTIGRYGTCGRGLVCSKPKSASGTKTFAGFEPKGFCVRKITKG